MAKDYGASEALQTKRVAKEKVASKVDSRAKPKGMRWL